MGFLELALIGVGLSMDAFAVSICKGLSMRKVDKNICLCWRHFWRISGTDADTGIVSWKPVSDLHYSN